MYEYVNRRNSVRQQIVMMKEPLGKCFIYSNSLRVYGDLAYDTITPLQSSVSDMKNNRPY